MFFSAQVFIKDENEIKRNLKANVLIAQLISIFPLFIFGLDYGRWIFIWISSSIFFTSALIKILEHDADLMSKIAKLSFFPIFLKKNLLHLNGQWEIIYLFIYIPPCCWTINKFFTTIPIAYPFVNFLKAINRILM